MQVKVLDDKTYDAYALKSPYVSIYSISKWGDLKEYTGWKKHLLGVYDGDEVIGVTSLLEKKLPLGQSLFYSPRGYLTDVHDENKLKSFHESIIKYVKDNHGFMLKVDPNAVYNLRNSDGDILKCVGRDVYDNFLHLGFKHLGFTQNFETLQPRYLCRIKLGKTYDETLMTFTKSTRKNIIKTEEMGVRVKVVQEDKIDEFVSLLQNTASEKHFVIRPVSYYKRQYELLKDYMKLYIAYIDTDAYYKYVVNSIEEIKNELDNLNKEMMKINVGDKIRQKKSSLERKIKVMEDKVLEAENLKKIGKEINIGALMSVFINNEGITFMSGTASSYKEFNPKYAFYNKHIKDSIDMNLEYVNFYGISGDMDKHGPYYGIYEMKKGFNPEILELVGEFDYIINYSVYYAYKFALWGYKLKKRICDCRK